jgi:hypothetical protein
MAEIKKRLDPLVLDRWSLEISAIEEAIRRRNRIVHDTVTIGYSWFDYATGGGEHVPVISLLGEGDIDEFDLRNILEQQKEATQFAVQVFHFLTHGEGETEEAQYCRTCVEDKPKPTESGRTIQPRRTFSEARRLRSAPTLDYSGINSARFAFYSLRIMRSAELSGLPLGRHARPSSPGAI